MSEQRTAFPLNRALAELPADSVSSVAIDVSNPIDIPTEDPSRSAKASNLVVKLLDAVKWAFSFPVMLAMILIGRIFWDGRGFSVDPDLWWHIKNGQSILATHHWPTVDPYSFTVGGTPWLSYEWLGDVAIGMVGKFGLQALDGFLIALGALIVIAIYYYASLCAGNSKAGFVSAFVLCLFAIGNFNLRPQMLGYLFLVITLIVLEKFRQGHPRFLYLLPPLFLVWINTHGSWIIGLGVILLTLAAGLFSFRIGSIEGIRWTDRQRLQLELALLGSLAAIPFTPYGTELAAYPFMVASSLPLNVANVLEWMPMPFQISGGKIFLGLLVITVVLQMMHHFTFRLQELLLAIGGTVMAVLHVRFVLLFVPFFAPIFAIMLARWIPGYARAKDKFALNAVIMSAAAAAMIWYFPSRSNLEKKVEHSFPVRAVNYIRSHPVQGPIFNSYGYGGYLVAYLPEHKVFIDGRGDLYELGGAFADYLQIANLKPAAFSVIRAYGIQTFLLDRGEPLATVLAEHPDWKRIYSDDTSVILVRKDSFDTNRAAARANAAAERSEHESSAE